MGHPKSGVIHRIREASTESLENYLEAAERGNQERFAEEVLRELVRRGEHPFETTFVVTHDHQELPWASEHRIADAIFGILQEDFDVDVGEVAIKESD